MERHIDARGLACPRPVILARDAIREPGAAEVLVTVDSDAAAGNVVRMAESEGWEAKAERASEGGAGGSRVVLTRPAGRQPPDRGPDAEPKEAAAAPPRGTPGTVVFITSDLLGVGDEELGRVLMRAFVKTLKELDAKPRRIIFANSGVRVTTEGSELLEDLLALERAGVEVLSCGTCLDYYGLVDSLRVGRVSNMYEIASSLVGADRVVKL